MEDIKRHHLCDQCYKQRISDNWEISPNLWCTHEYLKMLEEHKKSKKYVSKVLKEKSHAILNIKETQK